MNIIEHIQGDFSLSRHDVRVLLYTAAYRYKLHYIEKRHGRGRRLIAQPTAEIKILQRWAIEKYVDKLPIHKAATAYRVGASIKDHAAIHADNRYLLKLDFQDFFPSILGTHFLMHLRSHMKISDEDADLLMRLLFRFDRENQEYVLSIGAPSSPVVSNTVMYDFDNTLTNYCRTHDIVYSRYADDLALSTSKPKVLNDAFVFIKRLCGDMPYPRLQLNDAKTVFTSKKHRRQLTGLILTNDGKPSLGREKKRLIRSMAHRFSLGELPEDQILHLRGLLAFAFSIEPLFCSSINRMIGDDSFQRLMKG
ncbi:MAG: retron St85 family RNA-directed DNA polymerase [Gallionella sp.]|nr:retron St85 family RNA-directed DNA polymerase [Gallionella sp.]